MPEPDRSLSVGFSPDRRRELLNRRLALLAAMEDFDPVPVEASQAEHDAAATHRDETYEEYAVVSDAYRDELPVVDLLRSPHDGSVVRLAIDDQGLDGLFWNSEEPTRHVLEIRGELVALTGAMRLAPEIEHTEHLVLAGPSTPFVIPRLLAEDGMVAVVRQIAVGAHEAYVVGYFSQDPRPDLARVDTWGTAMVEFVDADGEYAWQQGPLESEDLDADLEPWIRSGRLRWIAPDDAELELRSDVEACPYVDVDGDLTPQRVLRGELLR